MTIGTLVHITAAKKLMIKISEKTYDNLHDRLYDECKKKNYPTERLAVYSRENDDGEEEHFAMVTPDKYDRQNMPKFERLLRKDINFSTRIKSYDFNNDDDERVCGINLELISIRQVKPKIDPVVWLKDIVARAEIDEIADKAAARAINQSSELNAEEQAIDEDVEKKVEEQIAAMQKKMNQPLPPITDAEYSAEVKRVQRLIRRRRTPVTATETELSDVAFEVKKLEDLIAANERAIGADE